MVSHGWGYAWKLYADEVMHSKTRHYKLHMVISRRRRGGDARMHNQEIFAHVLAYAWFYQSENFCAYIHF